MPVDGRSRVRRALSATTAIGRNLLLFSLFLGAFGSIVPGIFADTDRGAETMVLDGGTAGGVFFPHRRHQGEGMDCQRCHTVFPRERGSIASLKAAGQLKNKHVMNKLCVSCHRETAKNEAPSGPRTCKTCHEK